VSLVPRSTPKGENNNEEKTHACPGLPPVKQHRPWQIGVGRLVSTAKCVFFRVYFDLPKGRFKK
jgi:hypothetical protein